MIAKNLPAQVSEFSVKLIGNLSADIQEEIAQFSEVPFDRVKIPAGGGLAFEIPGDDPENPDVAKELIGVIVDHHLINAFWQDKYSGGNTPPECSSMEGRVGTGTPGGSCKLCPLNQFGSGEGGLGKACQNKHRIYVLRSGEFLPLLLTVPATSLKNLGDYALKRVLAKGHSLNQVITKITLKRDKNQGGIEYSCAQFTLVGALPEEKAQDICRYSQVIKVKTRRVGITADIEETNEETPY